MGKEMTAADRQLVGGAMLGLIDDLKQYIDGFIAGKTTGEVLDMRSVNSMHVAAVNALHLVANTIAQDFVRPEKHRQLQDRLLVLRELSTNPEFYTGIVRAWKLYKITSKK
jgi:hypothetical protein